MPGCLAEWRGRGGLGALSSFSHLLCARWTLKAGAPSTLLNVISLSCCLGLAKAVTSRENLLA